VYVKAQFFRTTRPTKKLADKFLGPYEIVAQPGTHSFTLWLPQALQAVHSIFHVSMLEPHLPNTIPNRNEEPPAPIEIEGELKFEIAEILNSKVNHRRRCKLLYLVKWLGYEGTKDKTSWLPADELDHASERVTNFHKAYPDKPKPNP
jgi:hypothetical protein